MLINHSQIEKNHHKDFGGPYVSVHLCQRLQKASNNRAGIKIITMR